MVIIIIIIIIIITIILVMFIIIVIIYFLLPRGILRSPGNYRLLLSVIVWVVSPRPHGYTKKYI